MSLSEYESIFKRKALHATFRIVALCLNHCDIACTVVAAIGMRNVSKIEEWRILGCYAVWLL
jgi:hypothetical protein